MEVLKFDQPDSLGEPPSRTDLQGCRLTKGTRLLIRADVDLGSTEETKIEFRLELRKEDEDEGANLTPDHHFPPAAIPQVGMSLRDLLNPEDRGQTADSMLDWAMEKAIAGISSLRAYVHNEAVVFKLTAGANLEYTWMESLERLKNYIERTA